LAVPHVIWLELWSIAIAIVMIVSWFATLFTGRNPDALHRFSGAFVRYSVHVTSFVLLVANPFPGFTGAPGSYPVDLQIAPPELQHRWKTFFRLLLAVPAAVIAGLLGYALYVAAVFGWFAALATGRMPTGLQRFGAYGTRYHAQLNAYALLLCDRYPYSGPDSEWSDPPVAGPPAPLQTGE
ncbi:MAG: DUF4389 domain-containing protein, partial [Solirubrobacteraceae bacterium]